MDSLFVFTLLPPKDLKSFLRGILSLQAVAYKEHHKCSNSLVLKKIITGISLLNALLARDMYGMTKLNVPTVGF